MAAYAALVSLMNNMEQIQSHPRLSRSLDKWQIESLGEKTGFFLDFIRSYNYHGGSKEVEDLESQIASAAHAAEDAIESSIVDQILGIATVASAAYTAEDVIEPHVVDRILDGSARDHAKTSSSFLLDSQKQIKALKIKAMNVARIIRSKVGTSSRQKEILAGSIGKSPSSLRDLQKIIEDMDSIKKKVMKVKEEWGFKDQQCTCSMPAASSRALSTGKTTMVGFDDELIQLMDVLTRQQSSRQIVSIAGMGGIGKTTLAKNIYENLVITQHFDIRVWATISQEYSVRKILLELLSCLGKSSSGTVDALGELLHKSLSGRRYLIILDDMWSMEAWDEIKLFFPDNNNGSRVVITTRLSNMAIHFSSSSLLMKFLDEDKSWELFCEKTFGQEDCPPELMKIGKKIVEQCKGLPLSIVVIGGLLRKSCKTKGYWQNVAENINSIVNSGENEQILSLSYGHLPPHLKPCFLYMGNFPEDDIISVSQLTKLWVAEGFLRPNGAQTLEEVAEAYLKDLIDRNLILVNRRGSNGKIKTCQIHDLLRDLCLRIAEKEKFFCVIRALGVPQGIDRERRIVFHDFVSKRPSYHDFRSLQSASHQVLDALQSTSLVRSLIISKLADRPVKFRLLRVLNIDLAVNCYPEVVFQNVNLRHLTYRVSTTSISMLPSSISLIWNLQTLIMGVTSNKLIVAPVEIWEMPQLRHIECSNIYLPDPPPRRRLYYFFVLGNLQTLTKVVNFRLSEMACKRIPDIKKLHMIYHNRRNVDHSGRLLSYFSNLGHLHKLKSLKIEMDCDVFPLDMNEIRFPSSLNKLSLTNCCLDWEDLTKIGSLPQLEVLKLEKDSFGGGVWSPINGEFLRLKFLKIDDCDLTSWIADSSHFPALEKLVLQNLENLNEIPWGVGEIPTLELIRLDRCSESAAISAIKIKEEQEDLGNDGLQIQVKITRSIESFRKRVETEGLTINNIRLEFFKGACKSP